MKKFLRIILAAAIIVTSIASVMGVAVSAEVTEADAVASIGTTYYESLDAAIDAVQAGDVIVLLKDMTATSKKITGKNITIKGEGTTKPIITASDTAKSYAFWIDGGSEVTFENIAFKNFESKNVIIYGTQYGADSNTYKITVDNCEFEFSASGAIYGYNCKQAEIKVTNSSFKSLNGTASHSALMPSTAPANYTYVEFDNNTLVGCGQELNTGAAGTIMRPEDLEVGTEEYNDTTAVAAGAVARIGDVASGKINEVYFKDLALAVARANNGDTIYILSDIQNFAGATYSGKTLTFKGVQKFTIKPSSAKFAFTILDGADIVVENLKFEGYASKNFIRFSKANGSGDYTITVKDTEVDFSASGAFYGYDSGNTVINVENCSFTAGKNGDCLINFTGSNCYYACTLNLKDITLNEKCGILYANAADATVNETYTNDAAAKNGGIRVRLGETEGGKVGEVYFRSVDTETLKSLTSGTKITVTCTCGVAQEITELNCQTEVTCTATSCGKKLTGLADHTYTEATCLAKAKCTGCQQETGKLAEHHYAAATCAKKATCTVCGVEKGNLLKHKDRNADGKCDVCDFNINGEDSTTTGSVTSNDTTTAADDSKEEKKKGCGSTVTFAGLALVAAVGSCAIFVEKKRR